MQRKAPPAGTNAANAVRSGGRGVGNRNQLSGHAAELLFRAFAMMQGWVVTVPDHPMPYDCMIHRPNNDMASERVQVKKVVHDDRGSPHIDISRRSPTGNDIVHYTASDFDLLAAVCTKRGAVWLIPWTADLAGLATMRLGRVWRCRQLWYRYNKSSKGYEVDDGADNDEELQAMFRRPGPPNRKTITTEAPPAATRCVTQGHDGRGLRMKAGDRI